MNEFVQGLVNRGLWVFLRRRNQLWFLGEQGGSLLFTMEVGGRISWERVIIGLGLLGIHLSRLEIAEAG